MPTKEKKYVVPASVVKLVKKVQKHILEEPKRLDMSDWVDRLETKLRWEGASEDLIASFPACGTTACIAGWTVILSKPLRKDDKGYLVVDPSRDYQDEAAKLLQIPNVDLTDSADENKANTDNLFFAGGWPEQFRRAYYAPGVTQGSLEAAKITVDRLEHFLTTGE